VDRKYAFHFDEKTYIEVPGPLGALYSRPAFRRLMISASSPSSTSLCGRRFLTFFARANELSGFSRESGQAVAQVEVIQGSLATFRRQK